MNKFMRIQCSVFIGNNREKRVEKKERTREPILLFDLLLCPLLSKPSSTDSMNSAKGDSSFWFVFPFPLIIRNKFRIYLLLFYRIWILHWLFTKSVNFHFHYWWFTLKLLQFHYEFSPQTSLNRWFWFIHAMIWFQLSWT